MIPFVALRSVALATLALLVFVVPGATMRRRRRERDERVRTAYAEAGQDDPAVAAVAPQDDAAVAAVALPDDAAVAAVAPQDDAAVAAVALQDGAAALPVAGSEPVSVVFEGTARELALDLAHADPRCAPGVLEAAARRAVAAWERASDGDDVALLLVATPAAAATLLYPHGQVGGRARIVVRAPVLLRLAITALHADREPARMEVQARLRARRYVEDRDTAAVLDGSRDRAIEFDEHWTFALEGTQSTPWMLICAG